MLIFHNIQGGASISNTSSVNSAFSKQPRHFRITIIANRCKECMLCINLCPTKVLEPGGEMNVRGFRIPNPKFPEKCIGCKLCEYNCPDFAIFITPSSLSEVNILW